ncbi:MAG: M20 family metallopeptidase [Pseudonocardiaceae bacterium]|jgi:acetylornithine deacetylase/succinyl-diaminopimelate desuccinylase-like protein
MTRTGAINRVAHHFDSGRYLTDLCRRIKYRTESQKPDAIGVLYDYLEQEIAPAVRRLGCEWRIVKNPAEGAGPVLIAHRHESDSATTVLIYGHGDVVWGQETLWRAGLSPWDIVIEGDRWYGRGTADSKGQHSINLAALEQVLDERGGRLGFNLKVLVETSEEIGSPGLRELCAHHRNELAAGLLIASDGPRVAAARPTVFLGSRGAVEFTLSLRRTDGAHHSGNWGGVLRNPATVVLNAVASIVNGKGQILVDRLRPPPVPGPVKQAVADIEVGGNPGDPAIDAGWGEPGLTAAERLVGWNTIEVLATAAGTPDRPVNAIPASAWATCQLRFVVGTDYGDLETTLRDHLDSQGLGMVNVQVGNAIPATRTDLQNKWVARVIHSLTETTGKRPAVLPNLGGTLPNDAFATELGMPTVWIPHSYPACAQHAPNEHLLAPVAREGLQMMAGLFWDLGAETC